VCYGEEAASPLHEENDRLFDDAATSAEVISVKKGNAIKPKGFYMKLT
jgi:hypothetical protein